VARIAWCVDQHALGVITREVGAGKTVAVRAATAALDTSLHVVIYLPNPSVGVRRRADRSRRSAPCRTVGVRRRRSVGQLGRDGQLAPSADLHPGDALLPALDESLQREGDGLTPVPGGVELDAEVVHLHLSGRDRKFVGGQVQAVGSPR